jgi:hypothetical protein
LASGLLAFLLTPGAHAAETGCGKLGNVQRWYGSFTLTLTETSVCEPVQGGSIQGVRLFERVAVVASGSFVLDQDPDYTNDYHADTPESLLTGRTETWSEDSKGVDNHVVREIKSLGENANHAYLSLNCGRRTYRFTAGVGRFIQESRLEDARVCHVSGGEQMCAVAKAQYAAEKETFGLEATVLDRPFDPAMPALSGSAEVETNHLGKSGKPMRALLTWTLSPTPLPEEVQVTVEPFSDYEKWIPEGNLKQPGEPGNRVGVKLRVHKKGDPAAKRKANLVISLADVSEEKGVCMNWPAQGTKADFGLRLPAAENSGFIPSQGATPGQSMKTKEPVEEAEIMVTSHDFGAYGILRVAGKDTNGREVRVVVRGKDTPDLAIPMDENHNHIADAWETKWAGGLQGQETDDEDSLPTGDGHTGDVLSLYEEYRGFRITGGAELTDSGGRPLELVTGFHVRTDPRVKDVFICDTAGFGIGAFRASKLQVHLVRPEESGTSQAAAFNTHIINRNRGAYSKGEQYVLWLEEGSADDNYAGGAVMKGGEPSVPRDCQKIQVRRPVADPSKALSPEETRVTVTHELAHACNLKHHGDGNFEDVVKVEYLEDESDGKGGLAHKKGDVESDPSGSLSLAFETGSQASGDTHCYMGYTANFVRDPQGPRKVWTMSGATYRARQLTPGLDRYAKTRFCDVPSSWELGPAGLPDAGRGNCNHQFCVNHLKH